MSQERAHLPATAAVTIAAAIGAAAGLLELAALGLRWWLLHKPPFTSPQVVWTAPLTDALLCVAAMALVLLLGAVLRPLRAPRLLLAAPLFIATCSVLVTSGWLSGWAVSVLAGGIAVEASRRLAAAPLRARRLARLLIPAAAIIAALLAAGVNGARILRERRASTAAAGSAPAGAPNVLVLVLDAVRASSLSLYGYARPTSPQLARLAQGGVVFERAFATAPWTLPSHASLFTGREAFELNLGWVRPWQDTFPTLAEVFSAHGYRTGGFAGNLWYADAQHGLARGFQHYEDFALTPGTVLAGSALARKLLDADQPLARVLGLRRMLWRKDARRLDGDFLRWASAGDTRPFFAFINYVDAHDPYDPPAPFDGSFGSRQGAPDLRRRLADVLTGRRAWALRPDEARRAQALYEESIRGLDASLGDFFNELRRRGMLENTVVVVLSDHGEEFGTHGHFTHGSDLYLEALHVPLLVLAPRLPAGRRVPNMVSLRDVAATVLDLAGIAGAHLPGRSLAATWQATPAPAAGRAAQPVLSALEGTTGERQLSVLAAPYHLIRETGGRSELYRFDLDPDEGQNLARDSAHRNVVSGLNALLPAWSAPGEDTRAAPLARR
ncbi:MAG TPA: sulfatase [Longimicrobiales bacterium]